MRIRAIIHGVLLLAPGALAAQNASSDYTEPYQRKALEIYRTSIGFRTAATHGQVPALAEYLAGEFRAGGFPNEDIHILSQTVGDGEQTAALVVRYRGDGSSGARPILLVAHMDVVDALPEDWERDPFTLIEEDGFFFGRGTLGARGEAVSYLIQTSEKTYATFELTLRNPGGHSSMPRADNAIYELATVLKNIEAYRFPVRINETTRQYFEASSNVTDGPVGEAMRRFAQDPQDEGASDVLAGEPAYVGLTRTTCVATMLRAGPAENALPQSATATVNCRIFPGVEVAEVESVLRRVAGDERLEIQVRGEPTASPASELRSDVASAVAAAVESRYPGTLIVPYMAPYGTDGRALRNAGIPTYGVMGLFIEDDDMFAHGLDERVPVREFFGGLEPWRTILTTLAGR